MLAPQIVLFLNQEDSVLDITSNTQSLTTFTRRPGEFMKQLKKSKRPILLTVNGKAQAVVQDAEAYQRQQVRGGDDPRRLSSDALQQAAEVQARRVPDGLQRR